MNKVKSENVLDVWILARFDELVKITTENLDNYKLLEPTRAIRDFIGDLSTWYLRRSRERIKEGDKEAKQTLYFVLKNLAKVMAPFAPLAAEDIWLRLKNSRASMDGARHDFAKSDSESVHLEDWPLIKARDLRPKIIENMETVRSIVTLGLEARQKAGIKVRQPLSKLEIKNYELEIEYTELIKEELNVKEIRESKEVDSEVLLDTVITPELKAEGDYRELVRALQDMRKKIGLTPSDVVSVVFETDENGKKLIEKFEEDMKKTVLASKIQFEKNEGEELKIGELVLKVKIDK